MFHTGMTLDEYLTKIQNQSQAGPPDPEPEYEDE